ncbi:MAG: S9 family peptidase [Deltaproteobacteria bacterium]|nr:S9 family peptidase [Deltaproteobacteria bacterium]
MSSLSIVLALLLAAPVSEAAPATKAHKPPSKAPAAEPVKAVPVGGAPLVPGTVPAGPMPLALAAMPGNANLLGLNLPAPDEAALASVKRYSNTRQAALLDVFADGTGVLIATRFASTNQLHLVEQPMGARTQLTFSDEPISNARLLPQDPNIVFFLQDKGGGEFFQLFRLDRRTQKIDLITDGKSRNEALVLSREGHKLAWASTARNGKDTDVYVGDTSVAKDAHRVTEQEGSWRPLDFAPAAGKLLVLQERSVSDADLWLIDLDKGEKKQLTPKDGKAGVRDAAFTADGRGVYLVTDRWSNFAELYRIDLAKPDAQPVSLTRSIPWNVESIAVPHDPGAPTSIAVSFNQDGYSRLFLAEPGTGNLLSVPLPGTLLSGMRFAPKRSDLLALAVETSRGPRDVYTLELRSKKYIRWTHSELGGLDESAMVEPKLVHIEGKAGPVPAFVYSPANTSKHAALVVWHGGPESQSRPGFSAFAQMMVNELGLTVVYPNPRGSDGYGKAWLAADDGVSREQALEDCASVLDWLAGQPDIDAQRIGVQGGSYGGYLVLATAAFFPQKIRAAVDVVGISNLVTFLENTSPYRRDLRRAEYGDERIPEVRAVLQRISPLNSVDKMTPAMFVQQGKNDPRVPQSEAEQIVKALRDAGRAPWYLLALNEGHGFQKKENKDAGLAAILQFLRAKLLEAPASASVSP